MPKRIVDGEGLWRSDKVADVHPTWIKAEYANLIPLALANGSFEANPRRIWSTVYSYNRPEITIEQVEQILVGFERVKLLFRWVDQQSGKPWGYWTRIDKPGRLPGKSRRGKNEVVGLEPPAEELRKFLESNGIHEALNGNEKLLGSGSGFGFGSGSGINPSSEQNGCSDSVIGRTKRNSLKEPSRDALRLSALLKTEILRNKADFRITPQQERKWTATADRMFRLDRRTFEEAADLVRWVQRDEFWMPNVLSMDALRKKFDQLVLKSKTSVKSENLPDDYVSASERITQERAVQVGAAR